MRVFHVFGAMDVGGAELRTIELMRHLGPEGFEFHFVTLTGREGTLADEIRSLGGVIHPLPLGRRFPAAFVRLLRTERADVLDSHVATFSGAMVFLARTAGVPRRIAHFRSDGDGHPDTIRRLVQRRVMVRLIRYFATDIVGVSPSALTYGYDAGWQKDRRARVVPNGFPPPKTSAAREKLPALLGCAPSDTVMIHVGRPSPEKNRVQAVRVVRWLHEHGCPAHLALVGGRGPDTEEITKVAVALGVIGHVHDLGSRSDAVDLISQADALILPSLREGLPGVVIEALSVGTPVVASNLPGVRYIATQLPGIQEVPLNAPLERWGEAALASIILGAAEEQRAHIAAAFASSPFSMGASISAHRRLYEGVL